MKHIIVFDKINEQRGKALGDKMDEIDELLRPYTKVLPNGMEEVIIPDKETALKYMKLQNEFHEIVNEIRLMNEN
jgi:hypothetical protein